MSGASLRFNSEQAITTIDDRNQCKEFLSLCTRRNYFSVIVTTIRFFSRAISVRVSSSRKRIAEGAVS